MSTWPCWCDACMCVWIFRPRTRRVPTLFKGLSLHTSNSRSCASCSRVRPMLACYGQDFDRTRVHTSVHTSAYSTHLCRRRQQGRPSLHVRPARVGPFAEEGGDHLPLPLVVMVVVIIAVGGK